MAEKGLRVRQIREKNNLSREVFGSKLGLSYDQVCKIENGQRQPADAVLIKIKDIFNVSIDYLITGQLENSDFIKSEVISSTQLSCEAVLNKIVLDCSVTYEKALQNIKNPELMECLKSI